MAHPVPRRMEVIKTLFNILSNAVKLCHIAPATVF